ncbi:unnamed protein product [Prunus brigantina]
MGVFPLSFVSNLGLLASTSVSFSVFLFFLKLTLLCETLYLPSIYLLSSPATFTFHPPLLTSTLSSSLLCSDAVHTWPAICSGRQFSTTTVCPSVPHPPLPLFFLGCVWWSVAAIKVHHALNTWIMGALPRGWPAHPHLPLASLIPPGVGYSLVVADLFLVVLSACYVWLLLCSRSRVSLFNILRVSVVYLLFYLGPDIFVGIGLHWK